MKNKLTKKQSIGLTIISFFLFGFFMYYFIIIEKSTDWFSRLAMGSIPLFCIMVLVWIILLLNYGDRIKEYFVTKPIAVIEYTLKENSGMSYALHGIISYILSILVIMLLTLIPSESYGSLLPFGDLMPVSEMLQTLSQLIQSMFQQNSITVQPGEKFLPSMIALFSVLASGPVIIFTLRQIRQNKLEDLIQEDNEKFTASKGVLIFVYVAPFIILFQLIKLNAEQLHNLGWFPTFLLMSLIFVVSVVLIEPYVLSRFRKQANT